jgi:hypothetical protein
MNSYINEANFEIIYNDIQLLNMKFDFLDTLYALSFEINSVDIKNKTIDFP